MKPNPKSSFVRATFQALGIEASRIAGCRSNFCRFSIAALALALSGACAWAQTTVTSNPADGATGVSRSAPVVFTFSAPMNPSSSSAFFQSPPSSIYPVTSAWSAGNTVLTCTPMSPFPANTAISWTVAGLDAGNGFVDSTGSFTTGTTGGGNGTFGTNATTSFVVGKLYLNTQTNASAPVPMAGFIGAYDFFAGANMASNRVATGVSVMLPTGTNETLSQNPVAHESYYFFDYSNSTPASFEAAYPQGNYVFNVSGPSNLQATLNLPTAMAQPNAPHFTEFNLAQAIDSTKPFTVKWDPFTNGTAADAITLTVSDNYGTNVFATPGPGTNGALSGTALSVTIPAKTLPANTTNTAQLVFYRWVARTNANANFVTFGYRATGTELSMITTAGAAGPTPVVSNPVREANGFGFDVATSPNQSLKVRFSTDCTVPISQWQTLLTTNSPGSSVHITVPMQAGATGFIRVQNGP